MRPAMPMTTHEEKLFYILNNESRSNLNVFGVSTSSSRRCIFHSYIIFCSFAWLSACYCCWLIVMSSSLTDSEMEDWQHYSSLPLKTKLKTIRLLFGWKWWPDFKLHLKTFRPIRIGRKEGSCSGNCNH